MTATAGLSRWDDLELVKLTEMIAKKVISGADHILVQAFFKKGALVPKHTHASEQTIYVLQGALRITVEREGVTVREGDVLRIPAGRAHQAEALDDTFVMVIQ